MKKLKENILPLSLVLIIPIINIFYTVLNNPNRGVYDISIKLDKIIPFLKVFIIPYIIWYPFIISVLIYFCFNDKETYYKTLISMILGLIFSYIIFFFYQTGVQRPIVNGEDVISNLVKFIYRTDKPYNCFPSIHVFTSYIMIKGIFNFNKKNIKNLFIITVTATLIIISTLFVKQHIILDVIGAIILSEIVFLASNIIYLKNIKYNIFELDQ